MATKTGIKLKRPDEDATTEELEEWWERFCGALREEGVAPGELFEIKRVVTKRTDDRIGDNRRGGAHGDSKASMNAAKINEPVNGKQRKAVLQCVVEAGPHGATSTEIHEELHYMPESSIKSRLTELEREFGAAYSQGTRPSANGTGTGVYRATEKGKREFPFAYNRRGRKAA